jgi:hypothetical protein
MNTVWQSMLSSRRRRVSEAFDLDRVVLSPPVNKSGFSRLAHRSELYNGPEELPRGLIVLAILCGKANETNKTYNCLDNLIRKRIKSSA